MEVFLIKKRLTETLFINHIDQQQVSLPVGKKQLQY